MKHAIIENDLERRNVFQGIKIKKKTLEERRLHHKQRAA
jgi:hypothetical protein